MSSHAVVKASGGVLLGEISLLDALQTAAGTVDSGNDRESDRGEPQHQDSENDEQVYETEAGCQLSFLRRVD